MKTNKIAMLAFVITASSAMLLSTAARSQTYKADFATKTVLASGGTDITNTITLAAPSGVTAPFKLTWPGAEPTGAGYILTAGTDGGMSWADPATMLNVTLAGDVTGASNANTVVKINGTPLGTTTATSGNLLIGDGSKWNTEAMSGDVTIDHTGATTIGAGKVTNADLANSTMDFTSTGGTLTASGTVALGGSPNYDLNLSHSNVWLAGQTIQTPASGPGSGTPLQLTNASTTSGALDVNGSGGTWYVTNTGAGTFSSVSAGSGAISTTGAVTGGSGSALDATAGAGGTVTIGNGNGVTTPYSTTTLDGNVTFGGTVTLPSGSVTASSLALADNTVLIGGNDGFAHAQTLGTDISTTDAGAVTVKSATGATGFSVTNLTQTNGALNNTGSLHTTGGDVNINTLVGSGNVHIGDTTNAGIISIGNSASTNNIAGTTGITGPTTVTGATTVTGTTNINTTGTAATTIGNASSTNVIAGGTTIGAVTLTSPSALSISSNTLTIDGVNSLYFITGTGGTVNTIAGVTPASGRIVKFINQSSGVVTLTYNLSNNFALNGSDVLLGPSGAVSLIYDGTNWDLVE